MPPRLSAKSRLSTERPREKNYKLYAVNFHGKLLKPICDEFLKRVKEGLRRRVFVIDLEAEILGHHRRMEQEDEIRSQRTNGIMEHRNKDSPPRSTDLLSLTLAAIERCRNQYDEVTRAIEKEQKFDLLDYWMQNLDTRPSAERMGNKRLSLAGKKPLEKIPERSVVKTAKTADALPPATEYEVKCPTLKPKQHNRVGVPMPLSKRKYIQDEPLNSQLFIIIVGKFTNKLHLDLLSHNEPLTAIIHFLPDECAYDLLVPNPERGAFIERELIKISESIFGLRKAKSTKPVGMFQQPLYPISKCLAEKFTKEIFSQLCWCLYDIETLEQHYQLYYIKPFKLINVTMPESVSVPQLYYTAESMTVQGHFLKKPLPAMVTDWATIVMYLDSLLSTFGLPPDVLDEFDTLLLSFPLHRSIFAEFAVKVMKLSYVYRNAFNSITKIKKFERLFVEESNRLLYSLITYVDKVLFRNIYLSCLEYNIQRNTFITPYLIGNIPFKPYDDECEPFHLPQYVKFYSSEDSVMQYLTKKLTHYCEYEVDEIYPGYKLYLFKRTYNEIFESETRSLIPTRLCFRDFTLYQMDQFLEDLVTPDQRIRLTLMGMSEEERLQLSKKSMDVDIDPNVFIRPNSLKARKLNIIEQDEVTDRRTSRNSKAERKRSLKFNGKEDSSEGNTSKPPPRESIPIDEHNFVGLPPGHELLKGYNLDDTRQEIFTKTSKYYFEEGSLKLYEERWCFDDMNRNLELEINRTKFSFGCPRRQDRGILNNIRMITSSDMSLRMFGTESECAKVVLNYPNGLTIYYHEEHTEQLWVPSESYNDERRRICTPHGAVIVHFKDEDMILIMRYNGEIYRLYQYEMDLEEEEEEALDDLNSSETTNERTTNEPTTSKVTVKEKHINIDVKPQSSSSTTKRKKGKHKSKVKVTSPTSAKTSASAISKKYIQMCIANELSYLEMMAKKYELSYLHLKLTTALGRCFSVSHRGMFKECRQLINIEWHDYFANESYALREDGVKIIWTKDSLKCFHKDGTMFTTKTDETYELLDFITEIDSRITESSSHQNIPSDEAIPVTKLSNMILVNDSQKSYDLLENARKVKEEKERAVRESAQLQQLEQDYLHFIMNVGDHGEGMEGEGEPEDRGFISYGFESSIMQHTRYAEVHFLFLRNFFDDIKIYMEIYAADKLRIQITREEPFEDYYIPTPEIAQSIGEDAELSKSPSKLSSKLPSAKMSRTNTMAAPKSSDNPDRPLKENFGNVEPAPCIIKVTVVDTLEIFVSKEECEINALLARNNDGQPYIDTLQFKFDFNVNISELFQTFVAKISQFKNYTKPAFKEIYFLERSIDKCRMQGFKFYNKLPPLSKYNFAISNTVSEFKNLPTMDEKFETHYDWVGQDMKKFPRFPKRKRSRPTIEFPYVLSMNLFIKIPRQLRYTDTIHKFLESFDKINFKKTRHQIKTSLDYFLRPQIRNQLRRLISKKNWERRHLEHQRRLFIEQSRKGLYHAMLKHKVYPRYHQFMRNFYGHVQYIDFFDFVRYKCVQEPPSLVETSKKLSFYA